MNTNCRRFLTISVNNLGDYLERKDCIFVDLREHDEYAMGHINGAINVQYEDIEKWKRNIYNNSTYKEKEFIFYCERGGMSLKVARDLSCMGYKTGTVMGGYNAIKRLNGRR